MQKNDKIQETLKKFDSKLRWCQVILGIIFACLILNLACLQIFDTRKYKNKAKNQSSAKTTMLRGEILDRNGIKLVSDKSTFDVFY